MMSLLSLFIQTGINTRKSLKLAIIGQSQFGADVYSLLRKKGHEVVGVFTIPDQHGRPDPLGMCPFIRMLCTIKLRLHVRDYHEETSE